VERRLAAILIADVVGYGRHSRIDEERTRERFNSDLHNVIEPAITRHSGRLVKTMGDGILAEFKSVVDATRCAIDWQKTKAATPDEKDPLVFRIGINIGDIISEPPDIHGDGVNLADRVQALASPGGIALSGAAYEQVHTKVPVDFKFMGARKLKSIPEPVRIYEVKLATSASERGWRLPKTAVLMAAVVLGIMAFAGLVAVRRAGNEPPSVPLRGEASLVILPFDNMSDDHAQQHLADGITEDLTTELARVPELFVIARSAAFAYQGKLTTPRQAASDLGVHYVLEGSVRRAGDELRVTAQLIDAQTNGHVWANRYDGTWADIFVVQDKIVSEIANSLKVKLVAARPGAVMAGGTNNPKAYEAYLEGRALLKSSAPDDWRAALAAYQMALDLDPNFGAAAAEIAWIYHDATANRLTTLGVNEGDAISEEAKYLDRAERNPSAAYYQLLSDRLLGAQNSDQAIVSAQKAIDLDPSDPLSCHTMAYALILNGQPDAGLEYIERANKLDPNWSAWRHFLRGFGLFASQRFEEAVVELRKITLSDDSFDAWSRYLGNQVLLSIYGRLGRLGEVENLRAELDVAARAENAAEFTGLLAMNGFPFKNNSDSKMLLDGLKAASVPELPFGLDPASNLRLPGEKIRNIFFGHELTGTQLETGEKVIRQTSIDGQASVTVGGWHGEGFSGIEGDAICTWFPTSPRNCYAVFIDKDARAGVDGFLYVRPSARFRLFLFR